MKTYILNPNLTFSTVATVSASRKPADRAFDIARECTMPPCRVQGSVGSHREKEVGEVMSPDSRARRAAVVPRRQEQC